MRGYRWPTVHKYVNYSGGSNTLNYKTHSRLLKSGLILMALHIQRRIITSQLLYPRCHNINCPKRFTAFRPVEERVGSIVTEARKGGRNSGSIYNSQEKIHTGYYQNWKGLSKEDHNIFIAARKKKGSKSSQTAKKKDVSDTKRQIYKLSSTLTEMKASIVAFSDNP